MKTQRTPSNERVDEYKGTHQRLFERLGSYVAPVVAVGLAGLANLVYSPNANADGIYQQQEKINAKQTKLIMPEGRIDELTLRNSNGNPDVYRLLPVPEGKMLVLKNGLEGQVNQEVIIAARKGATEMSMGKDRILVPVETYALAKADHVDDNDPSKTTAELKLTKKGKTQGVSWLEVYRKSVNVDSKPRKGLDFIEQASQNLLMQKNPMVRFGNKDYTIASAPQEFSISRSLVGCLRTLVAETFKDPMRRRVFDQSDEARATDIVELGGYLYIILPAEAVDKPAEAKFHKNKGKPVEPRAVGLTATRSRGEPLAQPAVVTPTSAQASPTQAPDATQSPARKAGDDVSSEDAPVEAPSITPAPTSTQGTSQSYNLRRQANDRINDFRDKN